MGASAADPHTCAPAHSHHTSCLPLQPVADRASRRGDCTRRRCTRGAAPRCVASSAPPACRHSQLRTLQHQLHTRQRSSCEVTDAYLAAIHDSQRTLNAFTTVCDDVARSQAKAADARRAAGTSLGALDGIPVSVKVRARL